MQQRYLPYCQGFFKEWNLEDYYLSQNFKMYSLPLQKKWLSGAIMLDHRPEEQWMFQTQIAFENHSSILGLKTFMEEINREF